MKNPMTTSRAKGQALVIYAISAFVLLVVIGIAIDGTQLYLNYTRLKRAVDASAIAAANDFKRGSSLDRMEKASLEILNMHRIDTTTVSIRVFMCDVNGDGNRDASLQSIVPEFYNLCPATGLQKKLIYVRANDRSPTYFLSLIGINAVPITTTAVAEAAPVDLVIVLDTSESMGRDTTGFNPANFNPTSCNSANNCQPLRTAKDAAKFLIDTLYKGYDRVAVVTFDTQAITRFSFVGSDGGDLDRAKTAIDGNVVLHDDPPVNKLFDSWYNGGTNGRFNPVNPEDRDNNGVDNDAGTTSTQCTITVSSGDRWDTAKNIPCDDKDKMDAFDWDDNGLFSSSSNCTASSTDDHCRSINWLADHDPLGSTHTPHPPMSLVSTCTGCGIREATANLVNAGRTNAVWVIVFLSDGLANMSDTPGTFPYDSITHQGIPSIYPNGFCGGRIDVTGTGTGVNYWKSNCVDWDVSTRYCIDEDSDTCPPGSVKLTLSGSGFTPPYSPPYSVDDYARDMADMAALQISTNPDEPNGNDIAVYTVGFGDIAALGEPLLRYIAAVGDDGNRTTDPCVGIPSKKSCGQYYFAQAASDLFPIFQDIASRIYSKISE